MKSLNLWHDPWITVKCQDGQPESVSLYTALARAPEFVAIDDPSPLVVFSIYRLLTAILQDIFDPQDDNDLSDLWDNRCFDAAKLDDFGAQYGHRFDLFSQDEPFLQSADLPLIPEKKDSRWDIAILFFELPTGGYVTHYQHGRSQDHLFCPACAARGLVTIPAFATSGGAGIKPSINGVPPIYVLPGGKTLFESLWASLILPENQPTARAANCDNVWWRHDPIVPYKAIVREVGYLHSLTFPARRVRLHPEPANVPCTRCGAEMEWGVRTMVYQMGESRPQESSFWRDPFAAYRVSNDKDPTPIRPVEGKALWREYAGLFLPTEEQEHESKDQKTGQKRKTITRPPTVLFQRGEMADEGIGPDYDDLFPVHCVGLRTDMKGKIFEWLSAGFDIPTSLLNDPVGALEVRQGLDFAADCARIIAGVFRTSFGGDGKSSERHAILRAQMTDAYWLALAAPFRHFILGIADIAGRETARRVWLDTVVKSGIQAFKDASEAAGSDADSLRKRVEGQNLCEWRLKERKKQALPPSGQID